MISHVMKIKEVISIEKRAGLTVWTKRVEDKVSHVHT